MSSPRLPTFILFLGSLLFFWVANPQPLLSDSNTAPLQVVPDTATLPDTEETAETSQPLYRILELHFTGHKHLSEKRLLTRFGWTAEKSYTRAEIGEGFERVIAGYRDAGFVFVEITPTITRFSEEAAADTETLLSIDADIVEGRQLRVGVLTFVGVEYFSEAEVRDRLGLKAGALFTETALERGIERVQTLYSEHGRPKVEIVPKHIQLIPETGTMDVALHIREGAAVRIGEIKVSGLKKTKTEVALREIHLKPNQNFKQADIDTSYRRLRNSGYFYQVDPNVLEAGETEDSINFHARVTEARTGQLSGVIGYAPPASDTEAGPQLTGVLEARETNLLGTGRQVNFYWKSGLLQTLRIGYAEPWIFGKPLTIGIEYGQLQQRAPDSDNFQGLADTGSETTSEEQSGSVSATTHFGRVFEGVMTVGYKRINLPALSTASEITPTLDTETSILTDTQGALAPYTGTKLSVTFRLTRDTRDYFLNPTRGRRDSIAFEVARSDFQLRKAWLSLQQYFPTWRKQTVAIELHGAAVWGVNIPPTELFYLGGATTLRGYDEDWFSGPRRVYANLEYRFLVGPDSQIFLFTDLGAVTLIETPSVFDTLRVGYGIGARLESRGGILRINYGLAAGDSPLRGKIHVNLGAAF